MKKRFYIVLVALIVGANGFFAISPALANSEIDPSEITCYSTWDEGGDLTIIDCLNCARISPINNPHDPGSCTK